jgi:rod shape-determining protein MreD
MVLLLVLLCLDLTVAPLIQVLGAQPLFLYLVILYVAFYWPGAKLLPLAGLVGALRDLTTSPVAGIETAAVVLMTFFLHWAVQKMDRQSLLVKETAAFLFVLGIESIIATGAAQFDGHPVFTMTWRSVLISSVYTALISPLFFFLMSILFDDRERSYRQQYELFR